MRFRREATFPQSYNKVEVELGLNLKFLVSYKMLWGLKNNSYFSNAQSEFSSRLEVCEFIL